MENSTIPKLLQKVATIKKYNEVIYIYSVSTDATVGIIEEKFLNCE